MKNKTSILIIGTITDRVGYLKASINNNPLCEAITAFDGEQAIEKFYQQDFDVIVLSDGIKSAEKKLCKIFTLQQANIHILQHFDDENLIRQLNQIAARQQANNKPTISFVDDALQDAMLPISIQ